MCLVKGNNYGILEAVIRDDNDSTNGIFRGQILITISKDPAVLASTELR